MPAELDLQIRQVLQTAQRVAIYSHIRPDGDAIGSLLGLGLALENAGKQVQMILTDGVPRSFRHLAGSDRIVRTAQGEFDARIIVDASDTARIGGLPENTIIDINIDHHVTNVNYARINLIEPEAVATAAVLAEHLPAWGLEITPAAAQALLTGMVTDTIGFRTSNMTPAALHLAADLFTIGGEMPELYRRALSNRTYQATRYWGCGLSRLERSGRLAWTSLTLQDRKISGYTGNDDADLNNILSSIDDIDIAILFVEQSGDHVKVSWRAQPGLNVSTIAFQFGGGGHAPAAGAEIHGPLAEVMPRVITATQALLINGTENQQSNPLAG